ncbi:unnamed protein product [Cuscuta campestris]|uniref:HAT C-terminal dimerisation domain-containing protein n=1 Tax=Cuscuta campestris TaxID=132261 RepID=A0A484MJ92_9ASTE|nr:unnamed protein product [Cuscuta campestris]
MAMKRCRRTEVTDDDGRTPDEDDSSHHEFEGDEIDEEEDYEEEVCSNDVPVYDPERMLRGITNFIMFQDVNPHFAKNENFVNLMKRQCPSLKLGQEAIKKDCLAVFEEAKPQIERELNRTGRLIPLSVDVLTHYRRYDVGPDFACLSAHFIDDDWKLRKWNLCFRRYLAGTMDEFVVKALNDWNLNDDKVFTFTSRRIDACPYAIQLIKSKFEEKNRLAYDSRVFSVRCCADMFGLMAQDAFEDISDIISDLKELHWSWHITNSKLKRALDMEALGEFNSESVRKDFPVPSAQQWEKVRVVHRLVEHAYDAAKQLFEVKTSTANLFLYHLQELRASLLVEASSPDAFTCKVANKMLKRLDKYIRKNYLVLAVASVMDPRCKMQFIVEVSTKFEDIEGIPQTSDVLETVRSVYEHYNPSNECGEAMKATSKCDLDLYLEEPVLAREGKFKVLKWWKAESPKYPNVSKVAREVLAIPVSVATSYDAYYHVENRHPVVSIVTTGPQLMNAIMCCRSWRLGKPMPTLDMYIIFLSAEVFLSRKSAKPLIMADSCGADPNEKALHPTAADVAQNPNGNDSIHCECGGNGNTEVDPTEDYHGSNDGKVEGGSDDVEDEDGSDDVVEDDEEDGSDYMDDEYEAINAILMQRYIANIFNPKEIEKECLKLFEKQKADVKHTLNNMGRLIPLSVDILSDYKPSGEIIDYVRLAANFVDDEWKLKKWVLHFRLYDVWNSDFIDAVIVKTLDDYTLIGRNMIPSETRLFHISCCAEMFGLMAEDAFEEISDIISMLKELCWSKSECMWHLTNKKIKDVLDLDALGEFSSASVTDHNSVPSVEEWEKVRAVHRLVEHANDAANKVFLVKSSTSNFFLYHLQELRSSLLAEAAKPDAFTLKIAKKMVERLDKYMIQNYLALAITSMMDPRCKMQYVDEVLTKFETTDGILQRTALLEAVRRVYSDYSSDGTTPNDLDVYLGEPVLAWEESFDVLQWWKSIGGPKYPHMSKMARDILAIPMSVATSYDAYYYIENRPADRRVITSGSEAMNAMMYSWSWKLGKSGNGSNESEGNDSDEVDSEEDGIDEMEDEHESKDDGGSDDIQDEDVSDGVEDEDGSDDMEDGFVDAFYDTVISILNPKAIQNRCLKNFEQSKAEVKRTLNNMGRLIPLSVDMLSDYKRSGAIVDYVRLAANFIDDNWKLKNWVLHFRLYDVWNSDFIDAVIVKTLDDYSLTGKVHTLTSRDDDTIDETIESIESQIKERNMLPSETRLFRVSCCAEMFGLMAEDAFEEVSDIISMLKELCWSKSECMWHLTNKKIKDVMDLDALGEFSSASVTDHYSVPSADEWEKVRAVHGLVERVNDTAKKVFLVKNPTANLFLYNLQELRASLLAEAASPDAFTLKIAEKMVKRLDKYMRQNYLPLAIASVMDPRFKMQYADDISTKFEPADGTFQPEDLLGAVRRVYLIK